MNRTHVRSGTALALALLLGGAVGCTEGQAEPGPEGSSAPTSTVSSDPTTTPTAPVAVEMDVDDPAYRVAISETVEDSVYPNVGDPRADALAYQLDLDWDPEDRDLQATAAIVVRATRNSGFLRLDLGSSLTVTTVSVDGEEVEAEHNGKDLVIHSRFRADRRYLVEVEYEGRPVRVPAPTSREDLPSTGWIGASDGAVTTLQQPFGAFTWFPVNDQPSDRALYDITVRVPSPYVGVASGSLEARAEDDGDTVTRWLQSEPVPPSQVGLAIDEYETVETTSSTGVPVTVWSLPDAEIAAPDLTSLPRDLAWLEQRLGAFPGEGLNAVVVEGEVSTYAGGLLSVALTEETAPTRADLVEALAQAWTGQLAGPADWRDAWITAGLPAYLAEGVWTAEHGKSPLRKLLIGIRDRQAAGHGTGGAAGAYDARTFAGDNVALGGALFWHAVRLELGEDAFWMAVKAWPTSVEGGTTDREQLVDWLEDEYGRDLGALVDSWLTGETWPEQG